jgi:hypothetical protein
LLVAFILMGIFFEVAGVTLLVAPRESRYAVFLGPMLPYRLFGILLLAAGLICLLVGAGILPRRISLALALPPALP